MALLCSATAESAVQGWGCKSGWKLESAVGAVAHLSRIGCWLAVSRDVGWLWAAHGAGPCAPPVAGGVGFFTV